MWLRRGTGFIIAAVCALSVQESFGGVSITSTTGSGAWSIVENYVGGDGQRRITIYAERADYREIEITATSGSEQVLYIRVESEDASGGIVGAVGLHVVEDGGTFSYITEISKHSNSTGELWISEVDIEGTIGAAGSSPGGLVEADRMTSIRSSEDLNADVIAGPVVGGGVSSLVLLNIDGDVRGDLDVLYGAIDEITVGGDIGSSTNTVTIRSRDGNKGMTAGAVWAAITANANSGTGSFRNLTTSTGGFAGSLIAKRLESPTGGDGMHIVGDPSADLDFSLGIRLPIVVSGNLTGDIDASELYVGTSSITVDGSLSGSITLDSGGLDSQIIVNAGNGSGTWTGPVTVGSYVLDNGSTQPDLAPYYERLSSEIGGGAIGLVPFNVHGTDCDPVDGDSFHGPHSIMTVTIRHYGPVRIADPETTRCVKIERRPAPGGFPPPSWTDVSSSYEPEDISVSGSNARDLVIEGTFSCAYEYRITPVADELLCDDIAGDVDVEAYIYGFTITTCPI